MRQTKWPRAIRHRLLRTGPAARHGASCGLENWKKWERRSEMHWLPENAQSGPRQFASARHWECRSRVWELGILWSSEPELPSGGRSRCVQIQSRSKAFAPSAQRTWTYGGQSKWRALFPSKITTGMQLGDFYRLLHVSLCMCRAVCGHGCAFPRARIGAFALACAIMWIGRFVRAYSFPHYGCKYAIRTTRSDSYWVTVVHCCNTRVICG